MSNVRVPARPAAAVAAFDDYSVNSFLKGGIDMIKRASDIDREVIPVFAAAAVKRLLKRLFTAARQNRRFSHVAP